MTKNLVPPASLPALFDRKRNQNLPTPANPPYKFDTPYSAVPEKTNSAIKTNFQKQKKRPS
jgi:hypothetical protein